MLKNESFIVTNLLAKHSSTPARYQVFSGKDMDYTDNRLSLRSPKCMKLEVEVPIVP